MERWCSSVVSSSGREARKESCGSIGLSPGVKRRERWCGGVSRYVRATVRNSEALGDVEGRRMTWSMELFEREWASSRTVLERDSRSSSLHKS